jgi:hypothetical protein
MLLHVHPVLTPVLQVCDHIMPAPTPMVHQPLPVRVSLCTPGVYIRDGIIVVSKGAVIPDGTCI